MLLAEPILLSKANSLNNSRPCLGTVCLLAESEQGNDEKKPRRFRICGNTGTVVDDWRWDTFIIDLQGVSMNASIPVLREHDRESIVGHSERFFVDAEGLQIEGVFSQSTKEGMETAGLLAENYPWQSSIYIMPTQITKLSAGQNAVVNGRTVQGPLDIFTKSIVKEVSFCVFGVDDQTSAASLAAQKEQSMHQWKIILLALGLSASATMQEAQEFYEKNKQKAAAMCRAMNDGKDSAEPMQNDFALAFPAAPPAVLAAPLSSQGQPAQQSNDITVALARRQALGDAAEIIALCTTHKLGAELAKEWIGQGYDLARCRELALDALAKQPANKPVGRMELGLDESDKFRAAASDGIIMGMGYTPEKPAAGAETFRSMGVLGLARLALERGGKQTMYMSPAQVASYLFSSESRLLASTADFSNVFRDAANKMLLAGYAESPRTYEPFVNTVNANDFKELYGISLSAAGDLQKIKENEEYPRGSLTDSKVNYHVEKYGKTLGISYEMIVNDDLSAFMRMPAMLSAAVARLYSDVVYGLITSNAKFTADDKALFHADHKNLLTGSALTVDAMSAARQAMRKQRGMKGEILNLSPAFLLVPTDLENEALVLLRSAALPKENMSAGVFNQWAASGIVPIIEPRLDETSKKPFYLVASPRQVGTIDIAFLNGQQAPQISEHEEWKTDGIVYKVRASVGAGIIDYRGFVKNPGA